MDAPNLDYNNGLLNSLHAVMLDLKYIEHNLVLFRVDSKNT